MLTKRIGAEFLCIARKWIIFFRF